MDISKVVDPQARDFIEQFLKDRRIIEDFYQLLPEEKYDFRMVDTPQRRSDSPRESLIHLIDTTLDYIEGVKTGVLRFGIKHQELEGAEKWSKDELLKMLDKVTEDLIDLLSDPQIGQKKVKVPWSKKPVSAISALWGLDSHEILHQGWNLAIMDHLNMERFPSLRQMWG